MSDKVTPEVLWAQRSSKTDPVKNIIYLTIMAQDVPDKDAKLDIKPTSFSFTGTSTTKKVTYGLELEFFAEIDPSESRIHHTDRDIELVLRKKELKEEYWPRLTKGTQKLHFLKTNFDKWVDEDEQDAVNDDDDYMSRMNAMGGGDGGFGGIDFSQLGQGAGGDAGLDDAGGDESDDDEDMPELEGDEQSKEKTETAVKAESVPAATGETGASATTTSAPKIEEVE